jgi:hypothetical protein
MRLRFSVPETVSATRVVESIERQPRTTHRVAANPNRFIVKIRYDENIASATIARYFIM